MPTRTDTGSAWRTCRAGLGVMGALLLVACASTAPAKRIDAVVAGIQPDENGFTLTEDVHVGGDVRADYDNAIRMVEQKQYEQGIPLLLKVTQSAPNLTAAHV